MIHIVIALIVSVAIAGGFKSLCHAFAGDNTPNGLKRCTL